MAKTDIKSVFRIVPIHPEDFHLLGMKLDGLYDYDTILPMGCSMSCAIFEAFSSAVKWIATNKLGISRMVHVLDDFLIIAPSSHEASIQLERFLDFCEECGIPISPEKTWAISSYDISGHNVRRPELYDGLAGGKAS